LPFPVSNVIFLNISSIYVKKHIRQCILFGSNTKHNLESSRGKGKSVVFTHIFAYYVLYSFSVFQGSLFFCLFLFPELFFRHSFRVGLLVTSSLSFVLSENVFISHSFLRHNLPCLEFRVDILLFQQLKILFHFLLASKVSDQKSTVIQIIFPL